MIEKKINDSLQSLEQDLKDIKSARKQVEDVATSYGGLKSTIEQYVQNIDSLNNHVKEMISAVETDYNSKVESFEKDRKTILDSANDASRKLSESTDSFQQSLSTLESKLKHSLILNIITLIALVVLFLLK